MRKTIDRRNTVPTGRSALFLVIGLALCAQVVRAQVVPPADDGEQMVSLNFRETPLEQVLEYYSVATGRTILQMPNIDATITLRSQGKLTREESLQAIESVLLMRNISIVPMGERFIRVVQADQSSQMGLRIGTEHPEELFMEDDSLVSQVIKLKHLQASEVQGIFQGILQGFGRIQVIERTNSLLVTATSTNIKRIYELLDVVDHPVDLNIETRVYELNHASAEELRSKITELVEQVQQDQEGQPSDQSTRQQPTAADRRDRRTPPGVIRARGNPQDTEQPAAAQPRDMEQAILDIADRTMIRGPVRIVADDRTNVLFVFSRPENFAIFDRIVDVLDRQVMPAIVTEVVPLEHADAEEISSILNEFVGAASSEGDRTPARGRETEGDARSQALRDFIQQRASERQVSSAEEGAALGRLSPDTRILADTRTNSILLMGRRADIEVLMNVVANLDIVLAQVLIEAVIVEVNLSEGFEYGIDWLQRSMTVYNEQTRGPGGGLAVAEPVFSFAGGQRLGDSLDFQDASTLTDRNIQLASGGLSYYMTAFDFNLDAIIRLAASTDDARILSTPVILTTDNTEARIVVGESRPVVTSSSTTIGGEQRSAYEYRDIGINLSVRPRVNPDRYVVMEVAQNVDNVGGFEIIDGNRVPIITRRELEAHIAVQSEQTIVLGGLVSTDTRKSRASIPLLSRIPVLGALFRADRNTDTRRELLVLMTPYVMFDPRETSEQTERLHRSSHSSETEWHRGWSGSPLQDDTPIIRMDRDDAIREFREGYPHED